MTFVLGCCRCGDDWRDVLAPHRHYPRPAGARLDPPRHDLAPPRQVAVRDQDRAALEFARYSVGATPVQRLNARVNALCCENPSVKVMSVMVRRGSSR